MPDLFIANGFFPNSNWTEVYEDGFAKVSADEMDYSGVNGSDFFAQVGFDISKIVTMAGKVGGGNSNEVRYFTAIAAGPGYNLLDKIQCEIFFQPTLFNVNVSSTNGTIEVTPLGEFVDIDPIGDLRAQVVRDISGPSMISTSLYTSIPGDSLPDNINNYQIRNKADLMVSPSNITILAAVSDSMVAVIDDLLMAYATAALTQPSSTSTTNAVVTRAAVQLGDPAYCIAIVVLNGLGFIFVLAAAIRSQFWKNLPLFDYSDLASMAVASAFGASDEKTASADRISGGVLKHWNGDPQDRVLGRVQARLEVGSETQQLNVSLR